LIWKSASEGINHNNHPNQTMRVECDTSDSGSTYFFIALRTVLLSTV